MNEKDWDRTAATFDEDVFNVPANDRQGLILRSIRRYAGKDNTAAFFGDQHPSRAVELPGELGPGVNWLQWELAIPRPRAWEPDAPCLYQLQVRVRDADGVELYDAMAAAVDRPMPGRVCNCAAVCGNAPPCNAITSWAHRCRLRARL